MNPSLIIAHKRDGISLAPDEIAFFVQGYSRGEIPDYQMAALAMAIFVRGMTPAETAALTEEMLASGVRLDWPPAAGGVPKVDKHSTGGIGDKTSLILAPLLACLGLQVPMISGRGLGATGGTLDKLEAIPGFRTDLSLDEIRAITQRVGCVITGATADLAPADRKLYALRDVTATVASIPLITASIMSKKLAENLDVLVLDVKFGSGAFMKSHKDAKALARSLVDTGGRMGVRTSALLTDMNQPLGRMVGSAVEVDESLETLAGGGPADLRELTLELAAEVLRHTGRAASHSEALSVLAAELDSGRALAKFREMVAAQGGDIDAARGVAPSSEVLAPRSGFATRVDAERLGVAVIELGGGRRIMTDPIDHSTGLEMLVRIGDPVVAGQPLVRLFAQPEAAARVRPIVAAAIVIGEKPCPPQRLIVERIEGES